MAEYVRYEPTPDELKKYREWAARTMNKLVIQQKIGLLIILLAENRRLTHEVNDHRMARGFDLLPEQELPKA